MNLQSKALLVFVDNRHYSSKTLKKTLIIVEAIAIVQMILKVFTIVNLKVITEKGKVPVNVIQHAKLVFIKALTMSQIKVQQMHVFHAMKGSAY